MKQTAAADSAKGRPSSKERRSFLTRSLAVLTGGLVALFPFAAGWGVLVDPLCRRRIAKKGAGDESAGAAFVRIGPLQMVPADGVPRQFVVSADVVDAWTRSAGQRVGSVFLSRSASNAGPRVVAFTAACPHLGCAVDYSTTAGRFECPCHRSSFAKSGEKILGPSLRGLDPLDVKLVDNGGQQEIWVAFQRFRTGVAERIALG